MQKEHMDCIRSNIVYLGRTLEVNDDLLMSLINSNIFTMDHMEEMQLLMRTETRSSLVSSFFITLKRRGPKAFNAFIKALEDSDQEHIIKKLNCQTAPMAQAFAKMKRTKQEPHKVDYNDTLMKFNVMPVNQEDPFFKTVTTNHSKYYEIGRKQRGRLILLNNIIFNDGSSRDGANVDWINTTGLFKPLGFHTVKWENYTAKRIVDGVLTEANSATHKDIDMFVMVLMSHGAKHQIMGTDMKPVDIEEQIISMFHDDKAPGLKGIPKLFLVQACRHDKKTITASASHDEPDPTMDTDIDQLDTSPTPVVQAVSTQPRSDILIAYATASGDKAWRDTHNGSIFIRAFLEELAESCYCDHMLDILTHVTQKVNERLRSQVCEMHSTFSKKLYLLPGYKGKSS